jgi:glycosyltransferase involved in cell wall biosynthesis
MTVLHLTHTSLVWDYRIIKELNSICKSDIYRTYAFGVHSSNSNSPQGNLDTHRVTHVNLNLVFSKLKGIVPNFVYYIVSFVEIQVRFFFLGLKLKPKIIHCHDSTILLAGYLLSKLCRSYLIYDAHELNFMRSSPRYVNYTNKLIESFAWSRINLLISVSQGILDFYKFYHGNKEILLIPNCNEFNIDSIVTGHRVDLREVYDIPSDIPIFIFIGAFIHGRGIKNILDAFSNDDVVSHLVFIGYGELEGLIGDYDYCNRIHNYGPLKPEDLISIASSGDYGLCLLEPISYSDYLSLPNKFYDYLNSNLKIISSSLPEIQSETLKHNLGYVISGDVQSILNIVLRIEQDFKSNQFKENHNLTHFNWHYHSEILLDKYIQILA